MRTMRLRHAGCALLTMTCAHGFTRPYFRTTRIDIRRARNEPQSAPLPLSCGCVHLSRSKRLQGHSFKEDEASATIQANNEWTEPWTGAESNDLVRIIFDCYEKDRMLIDPWLLSELLLETGAYSSQIEDAAKDTRDETPIFGEHGEPACSEKIWNRSLVMADYGLDVDVGSVLSLIKEAFQLGASYPVRYRLERIVDRDWQKEVQESWKPLLLGDRLLVKFTWHEEEDVKALLASRTAVEDVKVLALEGGAAFGSGEHPTTAMCCAWLQSHLAAESAKAGTDGGEGLSVCDYGAGSGILAMAALLFGAGTAFGVEIDVFAIQSAYRNAEMNGLQMAFVQPVETRTEGTEGGIACVTYQLVQPDGSVDEEDEEVQIAPTDVMLANILKRPLIELSKQISSLTKLEGGKVALAGLLEEQAEDVMAAYRPYFPDIAPADQEGEWVLLVGTRNDVPVVLP